MAEPSTAEKRPEGRKKSGIIDCDVHVGPQHPDQIRKHIAVPWRDRFALSGRDLYDHPTYVNRTDAKPPSGLPTGSDPEFLREQLIDQYGIDYVILLQRPFTNPIPNPHYATALAAAWNDFMAETWLDAFNYDGVFKGSICISAQDPAGAAKEIERWAGHPHMVQVLTDSGTVAAYGQRQFDPIYEQCERLGLPFAIHAGADGVGINSLPSSGYPTHYIEWGTLHVLSYQVHLISMLIEGVFERFPGLKCVLVEGGVTWLAPLLWRLDNQYERFGKELPWLKKKPSAYIRDHVRITSQPIERPEDDKRLLKLLELMDAENVLMFASDYPHWDFDSPRHAFPKLPERLRRRIFYENAKELYRL